MSTPQLIDDEEHERVFEKVAAVDVAKASGMVCTRTPHPSRPGARRSTVWTVTAAMGAVRALAGQLVMLYDGASVSAQMDRNYAAARTARVIAETLVDAAIAR